MSSTKEDRRRPQKLSQGPFPPGYDYETAMGRFKAHRSSSERTWESLGKAPNLMKTLFVRFDDKWERRGATYFHHDVFVMWGSGSQEDPPQGHDEIVSRETYFQEKIETPVAQGEEVTRFVVPDALADFVTANEEKARGRTEEKEVEWEEVAVDEDVRLLHGISGQHSKDSWCYWSDGSMTPGMDKKETGDMSAGGNGQLSKAAESLLSWAWEAGGVGDELEGGISRLASIEKMEKSPLRSLKERYGLTNHVNHDHTLLKITGLRNGELDVFYVVETIYAGRAPDGFVDTNYQFFDEKSEAEAAYLSGYPARKARKRAYSRGRDEFRRRHDPRWALVDENGEVRHQPESPLFGCSEEETQIQTNRPFIPQCISSEERLCYSIGHYLPTGENFGEGVTYEQDMNIHVLLGIQSRRGYGISRDEKAWMRLLKRLAEIRSEESIEGLTVQVVGGRGETVWREVVIPALEADTVAKKLREKPSSWGWGWAKEKLENCIDMNN